MDKKTQIVILIAVVLLCAGMYIAGLSPEYGFYYAPVVAAIATMNAVFFEPASKFNSFHRVGANNLTVAHKWLLPLAMIAFIAGTVLISKNSRDGSGFVCMAVGIFLISFVRVKKKV